MPDQIVAPAITPEDVQPVDQGQTLGESGLPALLPPSIAGDKKMLALALAIERELRRVDGQAENVIIWSVIERLEEPLLTHLAAWLHVDWWVSSWSLGAKRAFIYRQILLHRKKGTPWAVEEAVRLVYGEARMTEWFESGDAPGTFSVHISVLDEGLTQDVIENVHQMIARYKRKSQHSTSVRFALASKGTLYLGGTPMSGQRLTIYPWKSEGVTVQSPAPYMGGGAQYINKLTVYPEA